MITGKRGTHSVTMQAQYQSTEPILKSSIRLNEPHCLKMACFSLKVTKTCACLPSSISIPWKSSSILYPLPHNPKFKRPCDRNLLKTL